MQPGPAASREMRPGSVEFASVVHDFEMRDEFFFWYPNYTGKEVTDGPLMRYRVEMQATYDKER